MYRCIGRGFCGSVWAADEDGAVSPWALKREDGGPGRSLANDFHMHGKVVDAFATHADKTSVRVPKRVSLLSPTNKDWWKTSLPNFPPNYLPCRTLAAERIPPLPREGRETLIATYCPPDLAAFVRGNRDDADCLVRPYLGRCRLRAGAGAAAGSTSSRLKRFSLRNFPLHLDQIADLGLDPAHYATLMADALAVMHWAAGIDANDVEFVLASPRVEASSDGATEVEAGIPSVAFGDHRMWVLDFDCCRAMSLDEEGVEQAATAFFKNDPIYPRPHMDERLWRGFKERFLETSQRVLGGDGGELGRLPHLLMARIEQMDRERNERRIAILERERSGGDLVCV